MIKIYASDINERYITYYKESRKDFKYLSIDEEGEIFIYSKKPIIEGNRWRCGCSMEWAKLKGLFLTPHWKDSLLEIEIDD